MSCAKKDEPLELPFGLWTRLGARNHVLGEGQDSPEEGAIFFGGGVSVPIMSTVK